MISDFYENTTKKFEVTISYNGITPNISTDVVTFILKTEKDGSLILTKIADVNTAGATGIALFNLSKVNTSVPPRTYYYEISWALSSGEEYVLESGTVKILNRI